MNIDRRSFVSQAAGTLAALSLIPEALPAPVRRVGAPLPIALIGMGRQGRQVILPELAKIDAVKVVAVCDNDSSRLEAGVSRAPGAQGFASHKELLDKAKDVKAVILATPTHLHKDIAIDCLAAGKHVYCEAPMASTIDDCKAIAAAARGSKTVFACALEGRSDPVYMLSRSFFRNGTLRELVSLRAQAQEKTSWRTPSPDPAREKARNWRLDKDVSIGLAGEWGTPQFDVFHWFRGEYPVSVSGTGSIRLWKDGREVPDTIACAFTFADGVRLEYDATLASSFQGRNEILQGSDATIKLAWTAGWMFKEADSPTQGWEVYANRTQIYNQEGITLIADATKLASQGKLKEGVGIPNPPAYYSLSDFFTSVLEGKPPVASADEGMRASIVGILANKAVVTGGTVAIDPALLKGA